MYLHCIVCSTFGIVDSFCEFYQSKQVLYILHNFVHSIHLQSCRFHTICTMFLILSFLHNSMDSEKNCKHVWQFYSVCRIWANSVDCKPGKIHRLSKLMTVQVSTDYLHFLIFRSLRPIKLKQCLLQLATVYVINNIAKHSESFSTVLMRFGT